VGERRTTPLIRRYSAPNPAPLSPLLADCLTVTQPEQKARRRCRPPKDKIINIARRSVIEETLWNNKTRPRLSAGDHSSRPSWRARETPARHPFNHTARRFAAVSGKLVGDEGLCASMEKYSTHPSLISCKTHTAIALWLCPCNCAAGGGASQGYAGDDNTVFD
jgi:hypothetical protein